jgi:hypothetical protein
MDDGRRWALETFGSYGAQIREQIPQLVLEEHLRSVEAQEASGHRSLGVYGQFWRGILERFEDFAQLPGAHLVRPGLAPYKIPVVNGVAIFAWRYGRSHTGDLAVTPFGTSGARLSLFGLRSVDIQPELDLGMPAPELSSEEMRIAESVEAALADTLNKGKLVVVAISSSLHGLHNVEWGDVALGPGGFLEWGFKESLTHLSSQASTGSAVHPAQTFVSGEVPRKQMQVRSELDASGEASGNDG